MKIDLPGEIGAVVREVRAATREGRAARVVVASRTYDTTPDDLWDAITNAERIPRWFMPISGDLRLGGRYQLQGNAGGEISRCEPPRHLGITWEFGGSTSWVDVQLEGLGEGGTRLVLEHTLPVDDHWERFGPGAVGVGWDLTLFGLRGHVSPSAGAVDPKDAPAWMASPQGKDFVRKSTDAWCSADVQAGTSREAAEARAKSNKAAYTGEDEPSNEAERRGEA